MVLVYHQTGGFGTGVWEMTSELSGSRMSLYWEFAGLSKTVRLRASSTEQDSISIGVHGLKVVKFGFCFNFFKLVALRALLIIFSSSLLLATGSVAYAMAVSHPYLSERINTLFLWSTDPYSTGHL